MTVVMDLEHQKKKRAWLLHRGGLRGRHCRAIYVGEGAEMSQHRLLRQNRRVEVGFAAARTRVLVYGREWNLGAAVDEYWMLRPCDGGRHLHVRDEAGK